MKIPLTERMTDWTLGPDWPNNGEIDIIEGVNSGAYQKFKNLMSLHTYALRP